MSDNSYIFLDTLSSALTITLPPSPAEGTAVFISDYSGTFSLNNATVQRNGETILGAAADMILDEAYEYTFYYINSDWRIFVNKTFFAGLVVGTTPIISGPVTPLAGSVTAYRIENYSITGSYTSSVEAGTIVDIVADTIYWEIPNDQTITTRTLSVTYNGTLTGTYDVNVQPITSAADDVINYSGTQFGNGTTFTDWTI
jgi:hypothetical protein